MQNQNLTSPTPILDFKNPNIQSLIANKQWQNLSTYDAIGAVYTFVRDHIAFGYNARDDIAASQVLADGYGQCNTKGTLLMALLRALKIPTRLHGFTIDKGLQRGVVPPLIYPITPDNILHSWVEVYFEGRWINLEGFILDAPYVHQLQKAFPNQKTYYGYGVGTDEFQNPKIDWVGQNTYIQKTGINNDFGIFASPDALFSQQKQDLSFWKEILYKFGIRHWMNRRVKNIRAGKPVQGF